MRATRTRESDPAQRISQNLQKKNNKKTTTAQKDSQKLCNSRKPTLDASHACSPCVKHPEKL